MSDSYVVPDLEILQYGPQFVGERITIYWDGDDVFYPARVVEHTDVQGVYKVVYENDGSGEVYEENLTTSKWKLWRGSEEEYQQILENMRQQNAESQMAVEEEYQEPSPDTIPTPSKSNKSLKTPSYTTMIMEAIIALNDKNGSSLSAIRKYIITNYGVTKKQVASFNNLTLKAVNRCVAANELEKIKHSFRLTATEKEKRKIFDKLPEGGRLSGYSRKNAPFIIDNESLYGSVLAHNKALRTELLEARDKRDKFLIKKWAILKPFLAEKDYFTKRLLDERERPERRNLTPLIEGTNLMRMLTNSMNQVSHSHHHHHQQQQQQQHSSNSSMIEDDQSHSQQPQPQQQQQQDTSNNIIKLTVSEGETHEEDSELLHDALDGVTIIKKPEILTATLHEHQIIGISWLVHMFQNGMPIILGDQMGLGKTIQTIGFLAYLHETLQKKGPHLIVVPLSVLSNWLSEIEKFCPSFRAVRFHGPKGERDRIKMEELNSLDEFDIVVTTFEILVAECNYFRHKYVWTSIIVDEGHRLKNEKSQLSEKIRCIPCITRIILTGTPLQNNLHELWAMLHFLAPDIFNTSESFDNGFNLTKGIINSTILRGARKLLSLFMLRRLKDMVAISLPSRKEVTMLVPLTNNQNELYKQFLCALDSNTIEVVMNSTTITTTTSNNNITSSSSTIVEENTTTTTDETTLVPSTTNTTTSSTKIERSNTTSSSSSGGDSDWRKLMNLLLQLRKICNHPYLLPGIAPEPYQITEDIVQQSGKLSMLDRMLPILQKNGHRILIFSQFTSMLDLLEEYCELRNYIYVRLDGETNRVRRRLDVRRFNALNSNIFIFLISTRAGGLGLNLASADTVILYDSDWNPQVDLQAMERAHRIGQIKPVRVFRLICRGSVEERMVSRAEKKLFLNAMVAEHDPDEELNEHSQNGSEIMEALGIGGTAMSKGELASLIRFGANAVIDSINGGTEQICDEELYKLLECQGRDKPYVSTTTVAITTTDTTTSADTTTAAAVVSDENNTEMNGNGHTIVVEKVIDTFELAQQTLKERMEKLQEVDLHQLGNILYKTTKPEKRLSIIDSLSEDAIIRSDSKRLRKERIVMMDGKGTGYGGSVPVLAETIENTTTTTNNDDNNGEVIRSRGRQWKHCDFCNLCGKSSEKKGPSIRCAHCPLVVHIQCGENNELFLKQSGMFICPHHRCGLCNRPTSAAGGLLFRCVGCMSAYCEDCLPQDQIDSLGRCRELEVFDYFSKQAYFIKCPCCCRTEGVNPLGILNDSHHPNDQLVDQDGGETEGAEKIVTDKGDGEGQGEQGENEGGEGEGEGEGEEEEDEVIILPTHSMKLILMEIPDPPSKKRERNSRKKSRSSKGKAPSKASTAEESDQEDGKNNDQPSSKRRKKSMNQDDANSSDNDDDDGNDNDQEQDDGDKDDEEEDTEIVEEDDDGVPVDHPSVPEECSLAQGLSILLDHPIMSIFQRLSQDSVNTYDEFSWVSNKVESGRYRSVAIFLSDIKFTIEGKIEKKVATVLKSNGIKPKKLTQRKKELLTFVHEQLAENLIL